jgi:hypothetical protein
MAPKAAIVVKTTIPRYAAQKARDRDAGDFGMLLDDIICPVGNY